MLLILFLKNNKSPTALHTNFNDVLTFFIDKLPWELHNQLRKRNIGYT